MVSVKGKNKALFSNFSLLAHKEIKNMKQYKNALDFVEELMEKGYSESTAWMLWFENHNDHESAVDEADTDLYD